MVSILACEPSIPKKISEETIVIVAEVNQGRCFEESGQWPENVDRTHLVLATVKLVLQKSNDPDIFV